MPMPDDDAPIVFERVPEDDTEGQVSYRARLNDRYAAWINEYLRSNLTYADWQEQYARSEAERAAQRERLAARLDELREMPSWAWGRTGRPTECDCRLCTDAQVSRQVDLGEGISAVPLDSTRSAMPTMEAQGQTPSQEEAMPATRRTRRQPQDRYDSLNGIVRRCPDCSVELPLVSDNFRYDNRQDTFRNQCRNCERADMRRRAARRRAGGYTSRATRRTGRAFGVELELTGPSQSIIVEALRNIGINVVTRGYAATNGERWELKTDCSVNGHGLELVSPKLYGEDGFEQLEKVCTALRNAGATVDRSTGLHVHIDFRNKTLEQIKNSVLPIIERQDTIAKFVAPSRRTNHYCPQWSRYDIDSFVNTNSLHHAMNMGPRGAVNLWSYGRHGSIEFRSHGGSTRFDRIAAWVRFLFAAVQHGEANNGASLPENASAMLAFLGISGNDYDALMRFENAAERATVAQEMSEYAEVSA